MRRFKMEADSTVERIRRIRPEISEECGHNPKKIVEYYVRYQEKFRERLIGKPRVGAMVSTQH